MVLIGEALSEFLRTVIEGAVEEGVRTEIVPLLTKEVGVLLSVLYFEGASL